MAGLKRFSILLLIVLTIIPMVSGQSSRNNDREMTVEESYLQEAVEMMIIRETSRSDSLDQKLLALNYIGEAIDRGNTGDEVRQALEYLAMEGLMIQGRENGRLVNNFPIARREAAKYLGQLGTVEAKDTLINICRYENEPMVLQEAIKSLGDIGNNDNERTVAAIVWIVNRYNSLNPDNLMALSAVDAIAKLAEKNGIKDPGAAQLLIKIADGPYIRPVQDKAKYVLGELRKANAKSQQNEQNQNNQR